MAGPRIAGSTAPPCESETVEVVKTLVEVLKNGPCCSLRFTVPQVSELTELQLAYVAENYRPLCPFNHLNYGSKVEARLASLVDC